MANNIQGANPEGATASKINPLLIAGENAAGKTSNLTVEDGVASIKVTGSTIPDTTPVPANLVTALSHLLDSIDVAKMSKGAVTAAHSAITATATSNEIDCRGFNSLLVECAVSAITSGNWVVEVQGSMESGGTLGLFTNLADAAPAGIVNLFKSASMNANGNYVLLFKGITDYVKIVATRTTDGTLTCKVQPMNL